RGRGGPLVRAQPRPPPGRDRQAGRAAGRGHPALRALPVTGAPPDLAGGHGPAVGPARGRGRHVRDALGSHGGEVMTTASDQELLKKIQEGFRRVGLTFPYLSGLIQTVETRLDRRVGSMGIFASGRLVVNPDFVAGLSPSDLVFVLAHELYHLTLRTHDRGEGA